MFFFLSIGLTHALLGAMILLLTLLLSVVLFVILYLVSRVKTEKRKTFWKKSADLLLWAAIFSEEGEAREIPLARKIPKWIHNRSFRECLIDELVMAKKGLTGEAAVNIVRLYTELDLGRDSAQKLRSRKWHIKSRGIQELALMDRKDQVSRIYRHINNRNEFIRMEAQLAIVQLYAWDGLRFLDVVSEPISEWQQMKLLAHLPRMTGGTVKGISAWLRSANPSVVVFALKLVGIHRQFDLHDQAAVCLEHDHVLVRVQAVKCLREIYDENTAEILIGRYGQNEKDYKEAVLEALGAIGTGSSTGFLQAELLNEDNYLKLLAARALVGLGEHGETVLNSFEGLHRYPWNEIIQQAKSEQRK